MSAQIKQLYAFTIMCVLVALTLGRPAKAQTTYYIQPTGGVCGGVDFHTGTSPSGTDNLYTWSDLVTPTSGGSYGAPFTTRLNYTITIRYYYERSQNGYITYSTTSFIGHQISAAEQNSFPYNWTASNVSNTANVDPTAWFSADVSPSPGTVTLLGIQYNYQYFASMEDNVPGGICTWSSVITSVTVAYGTAPSGGW